MHPARPQLPSRPCPACGQLVDPLRAPRVVVVPDGPRYLCSDDCRGEFLSSVRTHQLQQRSRPAPVTVPQRVRDATRPSIILPAPGDASASTSRRPALLDVGEEPVPWPSLVAAVGAVVVAAVARSPLTGGLAALLVTASAALTLRHHASARKDIGYLAWAAGPLGAVLAAAGGWVALADDPTRWFGLAGAGVAAAAMAVRAHLDARGRAPVADAVRALLAQLPTRARVPARDAGEGTRYDEVHATEVRAGEVVLVVEGETLGVDGVVQAGEAQALLHPGAQTPHSRGPGDPLLAGARITSGALRVRASRVGGERALLRIPRFGLVTGRRAAGMPRLADRIRTIGGLVAVVGAGAGVLLTDAPGLAGALAAAGAVLLAAPLLAARRAAEAPFVAAAASAASRGIVFSDARTLDAAGRVNTAALCTTGTVTVAEPEVVEVTPLGDVHVDDLLGMVSGACASVDVPLAHGIERYVRAHGIAPQMVRRVVHQPGRGLTAFVPGREALVVGNRQLLLDEGISVAVADTAAARAEERGETAVFVGLGGRVRAVLALRDEVRPGARAAVQRMFDQDIEVVLISGDHRATVEALASTLDVQNVKAELVPEEQGEAVEALGGSGGNVAAVGFDRRDGRVLAAADVPIFLDAAGGAQGERGIALATDDVRDAAAALWIARAARGEAWSGVLLAASAGGLLMAGAALGWVAPAAAAIGALLIDGRALLGGARLLHRVALRIPLR
ncbi:MAG: cation-translocating P-type ATPase [Deltaproteobacteria bacterium]|nr:cation-translocating P-type ATPase [Deltaproteobacteria bacterium]